MIRKKTTDCAEKHAFRQKDQGKVTNQQGLILNIFKQWKWPARKPWTVKKKHFSQWVRSKKSDKYDFQHI